MVGLWLAPESVVAMGAMSTLRDQFYAEDGYHYFQSAKSAKADIDLDPLLGAAAAQKFDRVRTQSARALPASGSVRLAAEWRARKNGPSLRAVLTDRPPCLPSCAFWPALADPTAPPHGNLAPVCLLRTYRRHGTRCESRACRPTTARPNSSSPDEQARRASSSPRRVARARVLATAATKLLVL